jgi:outer membrane cobalamin receptor
MPPRRGTIRAELLKSRPALRPGEVLEFVPGLIVTQHSGDGKANQYFLRGFNLDHGTDFATTVSGMPVNMPTHGHGQGYSDLNFLIPELVERIDYRKGRTSRNGDFSAAGSADIAYRTRWTSPSCSSRWASAATSVWSRAARRRWPAADLLAVAEAQHNDGPWTLPEHLRKNNAC